MVINTTLTIQLDNIHVSIPSTHLSLQSAYVASSKRSRKRRVHRPIFIQDRPPFLNYASAYINPYRCLSPIPTNHYRRFKPSRRRKQQPLKNSSIIELNQLQENALSLENTDPIDLWSSDPNSFDMDFIRQRQMAIDNTFYREKIEAWKPSSFDQLIALMRELIREKNLIDRVWIIFYWISQHISYDTEVNKQNSDEIFHSGKTNCDGYAILFQTLCEKIGVRSIQIPGYVKDSQFHINQSTFSHINHIWNAVQLDHHHWYLLDCAWGSGYLNNKHQYKQSLQTFYFLTRPEQLIHNHLPKDSRWQFLAQPISMSDYFRLPYLHSYYFLFDLTLISPRFSSIILFDTCESLAEILIQAPNDIQLTCASKEENKGTHLTQYDASRRIWQCFFAPYQNGFYTLMIFANRLSKSRSLVNVMELGVEISAKDFNRRKILPTTFGEFIEYKCQIFTPFDGLLKRGRRMIIHCRIPHAIYGRMTMDGVWLDEILIKDSIFKQEIIVPEREIIVYAQFLKNKSSNIYSAIIRYLVED